MSAHYIFNIHDLNICSDDVAMALITAVFTVHFVIFMYFLFFCGDNDDCCSTNDVSDWLYGDVRKAVFAVFSADAFFV